MRKAGFFYLVLLFSFMFSIAEAQVTSNSKDSLGRAKADTSRIRSKADQGNPGTSVKSGISRADSLVVYAFTFMGDRYRRGGTTSRGFDCSGFTLTVFRRFGIRLPHTSAGQGLVGVEVSKKNLKKGDVILFKGRSRRSKRIGHVGIIVSEKGEDVRFIHSSTSDGVRVDRLESDYYRKRYVKAVRLPQLYQ